MIIDNRIDDDSDEHICWTEIVLTIFTHVL